MRYTKDLNSGTTGQIANRREDCAWVLHSLLFLLVLWIGGAAPAAAQTDGPSRRHAPSIVYVSNGAGGITEINSANNSVIATAPFKENVTGVAITPDGRRMYAADGDAGQVVVFDTATDVPLASIATGIAGEHRSVAITPDGAFVYVASQFSNTLTVIATATNTVVKSIPMNGEPIWVTFSPDGSRAYVSNQTGNTLSVVSTAAQAVIATVPGFACPFHSAFTNDGRYLFVSSQCDNAVKVLNPQTNGIVKAIPTGPIPRKIAFTPDGARAYVTNFGGNTVDVLDVWAQTNLSTPITVGINPWGMAMSPEGKAYVANFGDNTISVIESSTNSVTATLPARSNPEDVAVSTKARPRILNYSFQAIDPPGAVSARAFDINSSGAITGTFSTSGANGLAHGFLRSPNGVYTTIDVPGAIATQPLGINDRGVIVGQYFVAPGIAHGFQRATNGTIITLDFPGAADTSPLGINARGDIVGAYDTGDQSTAIGFLLRNGIFTSFEEPNAAPSQTQPNGINNEGLITGLFVDPAGSIHGFLLRGTNYTTLDFPGSDATLGWKTNDEGVTVGQYATNFPSHGFLFDGRGFLSFDYPDSRNSGLRGINESGKVVGLYRFPGSDTFHAFVAAPKREEE
jgi:YVTN family beta-propeller protein